MRRAQKNQLKFLNSLIAILLLSAAATQAQEVKLLWSDTHDQVLARHNAALYTPVETPPNWVNEKYSISEAQQAVNKLYPVDRKVVNPISVERPVVEHANLDTMTINGRTVPLAEEW